MKHILFTFSLSIFIVFNAFSQVEQINLEAVNDYKYIIVPLKYDFLSDADQYQINSLTKFLFNKYGYKAYIENDPFPEDLRRNKCLALSVDVEKVKGGFLNTKLIIKLLDCKNKLVSTSKIGKSREKEFKLAYNLALRNAFETFQFNSYKYVSNDAILTLSLDSSHENTTIQETKEAQEEIDRLKQEVAVLRAEKETSPVAVEAVIVATSVTKTGNNKVLEEDKKFLYAQPIDNGFQVVDSTPEVVMILLVTPKEKTFIVKDQNAIVYEEDGFWYISKNDGKSTSLETLNIKF